MGNVSDRPSEHGMDATESSPFVTSNNNKVNSSSKCIL